MMSSRLRPSLPRQLRSLLLAASVLPALAGAAPAALPVTVEGQVAHPGPQSLPAGARLAQALEPAAPLPSAYLLGAALLRERERSAQLRLKAGLSFDLQQWQAGPDTALAQAATALLAQLQALPVTGRVVPQSLELRWLQVSAQDNRPLAAGDRLILPARPRQVQVVGAVVQACTLAHAPLRTARDYLSDCPRLPAADRDRVYVIQPDGRVFEHGIALWNREDALTLAPGARLYVPLPARATRALDPQFNAEYARFLATQVPGDGQEARP